MLFRVLGPVEVDSGDGAVLTLDRRRERLVLGILLLGAGRTISMDRLCDLVWDDDPPEHARRTVRTHVARIRSVLTRVRAHEHGVSLTFGHGSYLLTAPPDLIDAHRFRALLGQADDGADLAARDRLLREALSMWRGPALSDAATDRLRQRLCADLEELRLDAVEESAATGLELGRHRELLPELAGLVAEHPVRERLVELHMLALYRLGRIAEALDVFRDARDRLADQLGVDPGPALQQLHLAILRGESVPAARQSSTAPSPTRPVTTGVVPAQLPAEVAGFVGREDQLRQLDALLPRAGSAAASTMTVAVIAGTAGVGKTALALRWAHRVRERFPDGQLYVNLRGYAVDPPVRPLDALAGLLPAVGVPAEHVPDDVERAASLYRSALAGRQILVVLDNAGSADQVRPLLPGTSGCFVLVTSRDRLRGLVARDGAHRIALQVPPADEAVSLLTEVVGQARAAAEPDATAALVHLCGRLPLALRIVAAQLVDRPGRRVADLVDDLGTGDRWSTLTVDDDEQTGVRNAFDLSYAALPADAQHLFRLLGLVPGPDITAEAAAALTATSRGQATRQLDRLAAAHLVTEPHAGRYTCHDLLRHYAAERARGDDGEAECDAAVDRLYQFYLRTVDAAVELIAPGVLRLPRPTTAHAAAVELPQPRFDGPDAALAWLDMERSNLVAAVTAAGRRAHPAAWLLADAMRWYLLRRTRIVDWLTVAGAGLAAATAAGDLGGQAAAELSLGHARMRQDRYRLAADHATRAQRFASAAGWLTGECAARNNLGFIYVSTGELDTAAEHLNRVLEIVRARDDVTSPIAPLLNLGNVYFDRGELAAAVDLYAESARILQTAPTVIGQTLIPALLGRARHALGRPAEARQHLDQALTAARHLADIWAQTIVLCWLAQLDRDTGHPTRGLHLARTALTLLDQSEASEHLSEVLNTIGTLHQRAGQHGEAADHHRRALRVARRTEARRPHVEALLGLATAHTDLDQPDQARTHATEAHALARESGYRILEADALAALAAIALATDRPRDAIDDARAALAILQQTGHRLGQANAHLLLGRALHYAGQPDDARHHWQRAHTLYTDFDSPAVHDVNKILTEPEPGVRSAGSATPRRPK